MNAKKTSVKAAKAFGETCESKLHGISVVYTRARHYCTFKTCAAALWKRFANYIQELYYIQCYMSQTFR